MKTKRPLPSANQSLQSDGRPRREFLKSCAAVGAVLGLPALAEERSALSADFSSTSQSKTRVAVIGAGAFGGWTALHLLRRGAQVTLLDTWGPGNSRSSSGGETRVIRSTYGPDAIYVRLVARACQLWREAQEQWKRPLFHSSGVLWMVGKKDEYEKASLPLMKEAGVAFEIWTPAEAARRYPQINFEGVEWAIYEPGAGYLMAREACQAVMEAFVKEGGEYRQASVEPGAVAGGTMKSVRLSDGSALAADQFVFACGPWLGKLFPDVIGKKILPTRQEVFFFGPPSGDPRFAEGALPVWIDNGDHIFYGIPANRWRGFKIADDTRGPEVDPTSQERTPTAAAIRAAREYIGFRFPGMKDAPLVESRVCQYENSPDTRFVLDRHPHAANVVLLGGGSGHGFKHGPALGEMTAAFTLGQAPADPFFKLSRF